MKRLMKLKRTGAVLPLILFVVVVLMLMGAGLLRLGMHSRIFASRTSSDIAARCAADAGLAKALFEMNSKLETKPWDDTELPQATDETLPNCNATYSYMVTGDSTNGYVIESFGKSSDSQAKVNCVLKIEGPSDYALFAQNSISLKSGTAIRYRDGVTADENLKVGTNSTGDGAIYARMGVTIDGDVVVGPGGDPDCVIDSRNEADITGQIYAMTQACQMDPVVVPHYLIELPSNGVIKNDITLTEDTRCEGISLNADKVITIDGPVAFYVDGLVVLENDAHIQIVDEGVNPDARLIMYLSKDFYTKTGGSINNATGDPKKLKIYGLDNCSNVDFMTDSIFYGSIYSPNADVKMFNRVDVYGSIIAKSFLQQVAANFYFDPSVKEATIYDELTSFVVEKWYE